MPVLKERHLPGECRQSVTELLKETYGYDGFRNLEIYDDLFKNRDTLCISQGQRKRRTKAANSPTISC